MCCVYVDDYLSWPFCVRNIFVRIPASQLASKLYCNSSVTPKLSHRFAMCDRTQCLKGIPCWTISVAEQCVTLNSAIGYCWLRCGCVGMCSHCREIGTRNSRREGFVHLLVGIWHMHPLCFRLIRREYICIYSNSREIHLLLLEHISE